MRSPITVWRRMKAHSCSVQRAGLAEDRVRDRDLADVVQLARRGGCSRPRRGPSPSAWRGRRPPARRRLGVRAEVGVALGHRAQQHVLALAPGRRARRRACCAYIRWSAMRSASTGVARPRAGSETAPCEQPIEKPVALLGQRRGGAAATSASRGSPAGRRSAQNSSPPMRYARPRPSTRRGRLRAQAREQRVARRVAEGVVVVLEAVEVEQREHERTLGRRLRQQLGRGAASARGGCPSPVSASVSASSREARSIAALSANVLSAAAP